MRNKKLVAGLVPSLGAAAALVLTTALIAEIAAEPTADPGIHSDLWTPATAVTALFFGSGAFHGSFDPLSILFGLAVIVLASILAGSLTAAFLVYCLGWTPHPLAASILGAACALAAQILLITLLCNRLQPDNALYNSLPNWAWFPASAAWGISLAIGLSRASRNSTPVEGDGVGLAGPSPPLSGEPHPVAPHQRTPA